MRRFITIALLAASPATAQTHSPLLGATPDTQIYDGGWELTPQDQGDCLLTHAGDDHRLDLIMYGMPDGGLAMGVPVLTKKPVADPTELTFMLQSTISEPLGQQAAHPTVGGLGTLLVTTWPPDVLLPALRHADRLNVFGPQSQLIRSVRLAGSGAAMTALARCMTHPR